MIGKELVKDYEIFHLQMEVKIILQLLLFIMALLSPNRSMFHTTPLAHLMSDT